jgi:type IV pilus assembly protein PilE
MNGRRGAIGGASRGVARGVTDSIICAMQSVTHRSSLRRTAGGFTLIELMTVVVVIAILAVIALPAYTEYVRKSRRAEAITLLNRLAQEQERWRASCPTYAASATAPANDGSCNTATRGLSTPNPSSGYYAAAIPAATAASYSLSATATGAQAADAKCATFTMTMIGGNITYASTGTAASAVCWSR